MKSSNILLALVFLLLLVSSAVLLIYKSEISGSTFLLTENYRSGENGSLSMRITFSEGRIIQQGEKFFVNTNIFKMGDDITRDILLETIVESSSGQAILKINEDACNTNPG